MPILGALLPVFGLIALGLGLRQSGFLPAEFWRGAERLTYFIAFPALLFREAAKASPAGLPLAETAAAALLPVLLAALVLLLGTRAATTRIGGPRYSSLVQAAIRPNTYLALAAAAAIGGAQGLAVIAIALVLVIPTVNLLSVVAVTRLAGAEGQGLWRGVLRELARNPLIIGSAAGLLAGTVGLRLPAVVEMLLELLARLALPLGLLTVGAALSLRALAAARALVAGSALAKLLGLPLVAGITCAALGLAGVPAVVLTAYAAMPASPSAYVLARELGGDATLMANLITAHTLGAAVTLPTVIWLATAVLGA